MNELITNIFKNFKVNNILIPVEFIKYTGKKETYITWQGVGENPIFASDDEITNSEYELDIDIYTKGNYLPILKEVKKIMNENDFIWTGDSPDMYENDTDFYHKTVSFLINKNIEEE